MAYLTTFRIEGDPDELLRFKQETVDPVVAPAAVENGAIEDIVVKTDTGLMVVNLWETLEGSEKTGEVAAGVAREDGAPVARPRTGRPTRSCSARSWAASPPKRPGPRPRAARAGSTSAPRA